MRWLKHSSISAKSLRDSFYSMILKKLDFWSIKRLFVRISNFRNVRSWYCLNKNKFFYIFLKVDKAYQRMVHRKNTEDENGMKILIFKWWRSSLILHYMNSKVVGNSINVTVVQKKKKKMKNILLPQPHHFQRVILVQPFYKLSSRNVRIIK